MTIFYFVVIFTDDNDKVPDQSMTERKKNKGRRAFPVWVMITRGHNRSSF